MKKVLKKFLVLVLFISIFCNFSACSWKPQPAYKIFYFENLTEFEIQDDFSVSEYFSSDKFEFAIKDEVMFSPRIKEAWGTRCDTSVYGKNIFIVAYSINEAKEFFVKKILIYYKSTARTLLCYEPNNAIHLEKDADSGFYEGYIVNFFSDEEFPTKDSDDYVFILTLEFMEDEKVVSKDIVFDVHVVQYLMPILPT